MGRMWTGAETRDELGSWDVDLEAVGGGPEDGDGRHDGLGRRKEVQNVRDR